MENKEEIAGMIKQLAEAVLEIIAGVLQQRMWVRVATSTVLDHGDAPDHGIKRANMICDAFKDRFGSRESK